MKVNLHWKSVVDDDDELWDACPAIYAYTHRRELLYIGKADGSSTVRTRWAAADKDALFDFLVGEGIKSHRLLVGQINYDGRLSRQMVSDIESLLIADLRPRGNIASTRTRISRPGLAVNCIGRAWPRTARRFIDAG